MLGGAVLLILLYCVINYGAQRLTALEIRIAVAFSGLKPLVGWREGRGNAYVQLQNLAPVAALKWQSRPQRFSGTRMRNHTANAERLLDYRVLGTLDNSFLRNMPVSLQPEQQAITIFVGCCA
jgi:hypothetical protein